jgi:hypothetical protein
VPATAPGLPIRLSDGAGITALALTLVYDPALLVISGVAAGPAVPAGAIVTADLTVPGRASISVSLTAPLGPGPIDILTLTAQVPATAIYLTKGILDLTELVVNGGGVRAMDDDGLHVAAYLGDATGSGNYSSLDGQRILRLAVGLDGGLAAFPLMDPVIVSDITGNGAVSSLDSTRALQEAVGLDRPEIPPLPGVLPLTFGPDPFVSLPTTLSATPGSIVTVPLTIDDARGLEALDVQIGYDPAALEVVAVRPGTVTAGATLIKGPPTSGTLTVGAVLGAPRAEAGGGTLLEIDLRVKPTAPLGGTPIDLRRVSLNEGWLVLTPTPVAGPDPTDGQLTVVPAPRLLARSELGDVHQARSARRWIRPFLLELAAVGADDPNREIHIALAAPAEMPEQAGAPLQAVS